MQHAPLSRTPARLCPGPGRRPSAVSGVCLAAAVGVLVACGPAASQSLRPWVPPSSDSLTSWAAEARARFRTNAGDSVGGANFRAYELVGQLSRRLLRSLGPRNLNQALGIKPMLDSLGLDADVVVDPSQPGFALVMVRNPQRMSAAAVGFLDWWVRDEDLRMQGAVFLGGRSPVARVWWTGQPSAPYAWAVVDHAPGGGPARFTLFRLNEGGTAWSIAQSEEESPVLGDPGEAVFADLDRDGVPELVQWALAKTDSLFVPCSDCPRLMVEKTFVERQEGFVLQDSRVMPSPYATLVTFVRLLIDGHRAEAARLVNDPAMVTRALAAGWGVKHAPGTWRVEYGEQDERWPRWLELRFDGPQGVRRYIVHFRQQEGHWIIQQWVEPQAAQPKPGTRTH